MTKSNLLRILGIGATALALVGCSTTHTVFVAGQPVGVNSQKRNALIQKGEENYNTEYQERERNRFRNSQDSYQKLKWFEYKPTK